MSLAMAESVSPQTYLGAAGTRKSKLKGRIFEPSSKKLSEDSWYTLSVAMRGLGELIN